MSEIPKNLENVCPLRRNFCMKILVSISLQHLVQYEYCKSFQLPDNIFFSKKNKRLNYLKDSNKIFFIIFIVLLLDRVATDTVMYLEYLYLLGIFFHTGICN